MKLHLALANTWKNKAALRHQRDQGAQIWLPGHGGKKGNAAELGTRAEPFLQILNQPRRHCPFVTQWQIPDVAAQLFFGKMDLWIWHLKNSDFDRC